MDPRFANGKIFYVFPEIDIFRFIISEIKDGLRVYELSKTYENKKNLINFDHHRIRITHIFYVYYFGTQVHKYYCFYKDDSRHFKMHVEHITL